MSRVLLDVHVTGSPLPPALLVLQETGTFVVSVTRGATPVEGAIIDVHTADRPGHILTFATTGSDGIARIELAPGRYALTGEIAQGPGLFVPARTLASGEEQAVAIRVPDRVRLHGSIRDKADGAPVADARVFLELKPDGGAGQLLLVHVASRADGSFDAWVPRGTPTRVVVDALGFAPYPPTWDDLDERELERLVALSGSDPVPYDVELVRGTRLDVDVESADGPVAGVEIGIRRPGSPVVLHRGTSDARGRFSVPHLAAGAYAVDVLTPGLQPVTDDPHAYIDPGHAAHQFTVRVRAARRVAGQVVSQDGVGVPGARVWTEIEQAGPQGEPDGSPIVREAYTAADGSFVLTPLPHESLLLRATRGTQVAQPIYTSSPGDRGDRDQRLRLVLRQTGIVRGVVVDAQSGRAEVQATVTLHPAVLKEGWETRTVRTDEHGAFHARVLPGDWHVVPRHAGYREHAGETVKIGSSSAIEMRLALDPGVVFAGTTRNTSGAPVGGVRITVSLIEDGERLENRTTRSGPSGRFRLTGLEEASEYALLAEQDGYAAVELTELRAGRTDLELTLEASPQRKRRAKRAVGLR